MSDRKLEMYGATIDADAAYRLIAAWGVDDVAIYPAVDEITLGNGDLLCHWGGGEEYDCEWTIGRSAGTTGP